MTSGDDCEALREKAKDCIKSDPSFQFTAYYYKWKISVKRGKNQGNDNEVDGGDGSEN